MGAQIALQGWLWWKTHSLTPFPSPLLSISSHHFFLFAIGLTFLRCTHCRWNRFMKNAQLVMKSMLWWDLRFPVLKTSHSSYHGWLNDCVHSDSSSFVIVTFLSFFFQIVAFKSIHCFAIFVGCQTHRYNNSNWIVFISKEILANIKQVR